VEHADSAPRDDDGGVGGSGLPLKMALRNLRAAHRGTPASLAAFFSGAGSDFAAAATLVRMNCRCYAAIAAPSRREPVIAGALGESEKLDVVALCGPGAAAAALLPR